MMKTLIMASHVRGPVIYDCIASVIASSLVSDGHRRGYCQFGDMVDSQSG